MLVEFSQLQLRRNLADRRGRLVDQFLVQSGSFLHAIGLAIQRASADFATAETSRLPEEATSLKLRSAAVLSDKWRR